MDPASEATGIVSDSRYPRRTPERADAVAAVLRAGVTRTAAAAHAGLDQNMLRCNLKKLGFAGREKLSMTA